MEAEFNLGEYLAALRRRWYVIPIAVALAIAVALLYNALQNDRYKATAVLMAEPAKYVWRLDQAFQGVAEDLRLDRRADYMVLLTEGAPGRALAQQVITALGDALPAGLRDPETLWEMVEVKSGRGRLLYLEVSAPTAALAQQTAGAWAAAWITEVSARYGQVSDRARFESELDRANTELAAARQALQDFLAESGLSLELGGQMTYLQEGALAAGLTTLQQEIVLKSGTAAEYRVTLDRIKTLQARAGEPGAQMSTQPLELLDAPLLIQRGVLTRERVAQMGGDLARLREALAAEETTLTQTAQELESEIAARQAELAAQVQERNRLNRRYTQAEEAARALERKVTEIGIQEAVAGPPLTLLGPATEVSPTWLVNLLLAGVVGLLGGVLLAFAVELARKKA